MFFQDVFRKVITRLMAKIYLFIVIYKFLFLLPLKHQHFLYCLFCFFFFFFVRRLWYHIDFFLPVTNKSLNFIHSFPIYLYLIFVVWSYSNMLASESYIQRTPNGFLTYPGYGVMCVWRGKALLTVVLTLMTTWATCRVSSARALQLLTWHTSRNKPWLWHSGICTHHQSPWSFRCTAALLERYRSSCVEVDRVYISALWGYLSYR